MTGIVTVRSLERQGIGRERGQEGCGEGNRKSGDQEGDWSALADFGLDAIHQRRKSEPVPDSSRPRHYRSRCASQSVIIATTSVCIITGGGSFA